MIHNLKSERVILREIEEKDWIDVHKYGSQERVCQYQPWGPNSEKESEAFVKQILIDAKQKLRSRFVFAIILKENGEMIGAGEFNIRDYTKKVGEIAYIVNPKYWGMGIATEVAKLLIIYGFNELNLHRIFATCDPRNIGSLKVLEKVGMTKEGRIREDLLIRDGWRDSLLYSILEQEWEGNK
ncbi:GNAT family N-acetyltransferase [Virgibacillus necropolis]|uniref:GNAT family N-acetyltransferase n=1 Tax=Virgibacillus necropolis TaxID=163877 RepID=A0A221MCP8_9BACI|nr:GNAT family protein [Virgibacillus necropolis]ASN05390.1 GNAT family N-acetyltransferase [Virgibacillus necropolis]